MSENTQVALSKTKLSLVLQTAPFQKLLDDTLGDPKRKIRFISNLSSAVATNPDLQRCEANTLITCGLQAEALELSMSPQLGYVYMVPFDQKKLNPQTKKREVVRTVATFILGYKGYIQLAIRSGLYADIDAFEVVEGEYLGRDRLTGRPLFQFLDNEKDRRGKKTIGYAAYLELKTGFKKLIYWDYDKMLVHADRYSSAFNMDSYELYKAGKTPKEDDWKYSSFWYQDFDGQAKKTMLRQLISKWGIMSIELQTAFEKDTSFTDEDGTVHYNDNNANENTIQSVSKEVEEETGKEQSKKRVPKEKIVDVKPEELQPEPFVESEPEFDPELGLFPDGK